LRGRASCELSSCSLLAKALVMFCCRPVDIFDERYCQLIAKLLTCTYDEPKIDGYCNDSTMAASLSFDSTVPCNSYDALSAAKPRFLPHCCPTYWEVRCFLDTCQRTVMPRRNECIETSSSKASKVVGDFESSSRLGPVDCRLNATKTKQNTKLEDSINLWNPEIRVIFVETQRQRKGLNKNFRTDVEAKHETKACPSVRTLYPCR
jgi:hypothetical protein